MPAELLTHCRVAARTERGALCHAMNDGTRRVICGACRIAVYPVTDCVTTLSDAPCDSCGATLTERANMTHSHVRLILDAVLRTDIPHRCDSRAHCVLYETDGHGN